LFTGWHLKMLMPSGIKMAARAQSTRAWWNSRPCDHLKKLRNGDNYMIDSGALRTADRAALVAEWECYWILMGKSVPGDGGGRLLLKGLKGHSDSGSGSVEWIGVSWPRLGSGVWGLS
jgi:hypothetical protein